jgi:glutathione S-transferase
VELTLYIGNKNYSSWSFRGWLAMRMAGAPFREVLFHLGDPASREKIRAVSPGGRVPALHHGELGVWDSLAIAEYLAETFPERNLWPKDREARATARALAAEMHSGFQNLRKNMPMNLRRSSPGVGHLPEVMEEIAHITGAWKRARSRFGSEGPFLFGAWSLADCFYAPVIGRLRTYAVPLDPETQAYADAVWAQPDVRAWVEAAKAEPMKEPQYDV